MAGEYIPVALERLVTERARGRCEYCQCPEAFSSGAFEIEHIQPRSLGGATDADNPAFSYGGCNGFKGVKVSGLDPQIEEIASLFHPRQDVWNEHFCWSSEALLIEASRPKVARRFWHFVSTESAWSICEDCGCWMINTPTR